MNKELIERWSGGIHYYVDPTTPSDVYFEEDAINRLKSDECELSITELSLYIREHNTKYQPILLTWEMTSRCNFDCPFCYIRDNTIETEVGFEEVKEVIDGLTEEGLFEVYLSGGECLLLNDFLKIYSYIKNKGVFVTVFTNGSLINEEILECWRKLPPSSVEMTFYNDKTDSKPFTNLLKLRDMGISTLPKFTMTNTTIGYYENVKRWMEEHGFVLNVDSTLYDGLDDLHSGIENKYSISLKQKKQYLLDSKVEDEPKTVIRTGLSCKSKKGIIHIAPDFSMSLCNKMKTRWNLRTVNAATALNELRGVIKKYEDATLHGCNGCIYSRNCSMCLVSAENIDGELYVPKGYCDSIRKKSLGI